MPVAPTYPGVYVQELSSGVRTIAGVATSIAAFVGFFKKGPMNDAIRVLSFGEFERNFGGLDVESEASYAIQQFFLNGGTEAWIVRTAATGGDGGPDTASVTLDDGSSDVIVIDASSAGSWGNAISVTVDYDTKDTTDTTLFNLTVTDGSTVEIFRNLNMDPNSSAYAVDAVNDGSVLVDADLPAVPPAITARPSVGDSPLTGGLNGVVPTATELTGDEDDKTGIYALLDVDLFNILCIPDTMLLDDLEAASVAAAATKLCDDERAFYIMDIPQQDGDRDSFTEVQSWLSANSTLRDKNVAMYFPRPQIADSLKDYRLRPVAVSGTMAGLYARTDSTRGVWKAPAGTEAVLRGVQKLSYRLTDGENGVLNPLAVNCLRTFPVYGNVAWGARTMDGADQIGSEWKYLPVRRLALYLEESLFRGTQWVVFEPNDEPLWAQIRLNIGAFLHTLFRQGAFQGSKPSDAYFVKCDRETTTQTDINNGIVNIIVGFAPLKPAEFVIISIQQMAGQIDT